MFDLNNSTALRQSVYLLVKHFSSHASAMTKSDDCNPISTHDHFTTSSWELFRFSQVNENYFFYIGTKLNRRLLGHSLVLHFSV